MKKRTWMISMILVLITALIPITSAFAVTRVPAMPDESHTIKYAEDGQTYYYVHGKISTQTNGLTMINGIWYYLKAGRVVREYKGEVISYAGRLYVIEDGMIDYSATGDYSYNGKIFQFINGRLVTDSSMDGWQQADGKWYYFNPNSQLVTGWVGQYYLTMDGSMATGWTEINNRWHYFKSTGERQLGWVKDGSSWYYLEAPEGRATGWRKIDGVWYWFNDQGVMATGWRKIDGAWYWFNNQGVMVTGWQKIDGQWELFDSNGVWLETWKG